MNRLSRLFTVVGQNDEFVILKTSQECLKNEEALIALKLAGFDGRESYIRVALTSRSPRELQGATLWYSGRLPENVHTYFFGESYVNDFIGRRVETSLEEVLKDHGIL